MSIPRTLPLVMIVVAVLGFAYGSEPGSLFNRAAAQETRNPLLWPFSQDSIWNTPIGADAVYVDAQVQPSTQRGMTVDEDILILEPNAPLTNMFENFVAWNSSEEGARCPAEGDLIGQFPIPADFLRGQPQNTTENNAVAILMPDGRTLKQNQPFTRCAAGGIATSLFIYPDVDIYGDGTEGAHGGSGLSSIGGTIRLGELVPGGTIRHAMKVNLYSRKNYFRGEDEADGKAGYRWPAAHADNVSSQTYQGTNPVLQMGSLLAIHKDVNLDENELGLETEPAQILARAFQDYGAYVVDDTAWDVYAVATEYSPDGTVVAEFEEAWGFPINIFEKETPWARDMDRIFTNLYVIDNNSPESVGGGGVRRAALAPPFAEQGASPEATTSPTPNLTPQPEPAEAVLLPLLLMREFLLGITTPVPSLTETPSSPMTETPTPTPTPTATSRPSATNTPSSVPTVQVTYVEETTDFLNPERGFHDNLDLIEETELGWVVENGYSLARSYIRLDDYRSSPIPQDTLDRIERGFDAARAAGIKIIPRFAYNFPGADYQNAQDAPLAQVQAHLEQLAPIFQRHADVIAVHQAGFIGAWGEWHSSSNGLDTPENRRAVLDALLDAVDETRMVQLRYPGDLLELYPDVLTEAGAFSGSNQARTAHHNDCFLANESDAGTYFPLESKASFQNYLDGLVPWVAVGGETCQVDAGSQRTDCETALAELERFHWSYLNPAFFDEALQQWRDEGCYDEISRRLGYRFRLIQATAPQSVMAGDTLALELEMTNDGWALPYNPRGAALVLRHVETLVEAKVPLDQIDPRTWLPKPGETQPITILSLIDESIPSGEYALLLHLFDPAPNLSERPEYAIRLANNGIWEADTGYNSLSIVINVQ